MIYHTCLQRHHLTEFHPWLNVRAKVNDVQLDMRTDDRHIRRARWQHKRRTIDCRRASPCARTHITLCTSQCHDNVYKHKYIQICIYIIYIYMCWELFLRTSRATLECERRAQSHNTLSYMMSVDTPMFFCADGRYRECSPQMVWRNQTCMQPTHATQH